MPAVQEILSKEYLAHMAPIVDVKNRTPEEHDAKAKQHRDLANDFSQQLDQVNSKGFDSAPAQKFFGESAKDLDPTAFKTKNGMGKYAALPELKSQLRSAQRFHDQQANHHSSMAGGKRNGGDYPSDEAYYADPVGEFLSHHGVKGMHWGVRRSRSSGSSGSSSSGKPSHKEAKRTKKHDALIAKAKEHENISKVHAKAAKDLETRHNELLKNGVASKEFAKAFGEGAKDQNENSFYWKNGRSKAQALGETSNNIRMLHNSYARSSNRHSEKAKKLREKAAEVKHTDIDPDSVLIHDAEDLNEEIEDFLEHFGVKGMHWGVRNDHSSGGRKAGPVSEDAARSKALKGTVKKHGTKALSNEELQALVTRMNLEQQHGKLSKNDISAGEKFLRDLAGTGQKTLSDLATDTVSKGIDSLVKSGSQKLATAGK